MSTLYESIKALCDENGIKPGKMCVELGISKSMMTGLKNGTKQSIQVETAQKIADYFGVSVDRVLGTEQKKEKPVPGRDEPNKIKLLDSVDSMNMSELLELMQKVTDAIQKRGNV